MRASKILLIFIAALTLAGMPAGANAARLWSSGCEFQGDSPGNMTNNLEWDVSGDAAASTQIVASTKRSGLSSCGIIRATDGYGQLRQQFASVSVATDLYFRFYIYISTLPDENADIVALEAAGDGDTEGALVLNTDGTLEWRDDSLLADGVYATPLSTGTWYRIEINYDAADEVIVRLDGTEIINAGTHNGDDIGDINIGLCTIQATSICTSGDATATLYYDDIAINDTSGGSQTSWPGVGNIVHMQPDGDEGAPDCNVGNSGSVDEVTPDDVTSYCDFIADGGGEIADFTVESSSNAGIDSYDTVTLVQVGIREAAVSAAAEFWNVRLKSASGGTTSSGSATGHDDTTYRTNGDLAPRNYTLTSYTDPTTALAWTPTGTNSLNNMIVGVTSIDANPDIRISTLWGLVEYVDGASPGSNIRIGLKSRIWRFKSGRFILRSN